MAEQPTQFEDHDVHVSNDPKQVRLTFAGGGWVLIVMGIVCLALLALATWKPLAAIVTTGSLNRPPGDGETLESYGFDISNLELDRQYIEPVLLHRDMVPVMDEPSYLTAEQVQELGGRDKYLVSTDRVVGIELNGEARAYPVSILTVHEIIHDELGGVPIAITYSWPCDSVVVFDRQYEGETLHFGVSGWLYHANMMFYARNADAVGDESLYVQLQGQAVSGQRKGQTLRRVKYQFVDWQTWLDLHPKTSVVDRVVDLRKRYKGATPTQYFESPELEGFTKVAPLPADSPIEPKTRVVAIHDSRGSKVYSHPWFREQMNSNNRVPVRMTMGSLLFEVHAASETVQLQWQPQRATLHATHCLWFAWKAQFPDAELVE